MAGSESQLTIGALSRRTGCHVETIRFYERVRLLPKPRRSAGGYRLYELGHLKRLTFIRRARDLGFTLEEVRMLLRLADERARPCAEVRDVAAAHLEDVRAKIADLQAMEGVLAAVVARCADGTRPECPVIEALYRETSEAAVTASGPRRERPGGGRRGGILRTRRRARAAGPSAPGRPAHRRTGR